MTSPRDADAGRSCASAVFPSGPTRPLRVLVVDDHLLARCSIRWQLQEMPNLQVVGEAVDSFEAAALARTLSLDLVFVDICMPGLDGLEATWRIRAESSRVRVIILSSLDGEPYRKAARDAGAAAYLVKGQTIAHLAAALQQISASRLLCAGAARYRHVGPDLTPQPHCSPSLSRPAFLRSAGVMAIRNSTSAWNVKNQGSARAGMLDASGRSTAITAPRCPLCSVK